MTTRHRIIWRSQRTGFVGHGEWLNLSKEEVETLAAYKDGEHPGFSHRVEAEVAVASAQGKDEP
jgi:hypothetical protein